MIAKANKITTIKLKNVVACVIRAILTIINTITRTAALNNTNGTKLMPRQESRNNFEFL